MKSYLATCCRIGAALVVAAAGILDLIDQTTMLVLVVVLVCLPSQRECLGRQGVGQ